MVITRISETNMGLIVDTVSEVVDIPAGSIEPPPQFKSDSRREHYIAGIGKVEDEVKILLDVSKLLRGEEVEEIRANAPEAK
jgi:purine-binding chemotaxis protein CheW